MDLCGPIWNGKGQPREIFQHIPTIKWWGLSPKCHMFIDFATPGLLEEKSQNPKELNIFKKMVQHSPEAFQNYQRKTPAPLVQPVSLSFGSFSLASLPPFASLPFNKRRSWTCRNQRNQRCRLKKHRPYEWIYVGPFGIERGNPGKYFINIFQL